MIEAMSDERLAKIRAWVRPEPGVRQAAGSIDSADMLDEIDRLRANNAELQQKARDTWAAYVGADAMLKASEERERIIQDHRERQFLWWAFPIAEPPYVGSPLWTDFTPDLTHWQRIVVPTEPQR